MDHTNGTHGKQKSKCSWTSVRGARSAIQQTRPTLSKVRGGNRGKVKRSRGDVSVYLCEKGWRFPVIHKAIALTWNLQPSR